MSTIMANSPNVSKTRADRSKAAERPALPAAAPSAPDPADAELPNLCEGPTGPVGGD